MREWRPVISYQGRYEVSNDGYVRSVKSRRVLKNCRHRQGYHLVTLYRDGIRKTRLVHHLVIEAFGLLKPSPDHQVNHKNGIKTDNRIENLEWVTSSENNRHALVMGLRKMPAGESHPRAKLNNVKVRLIRKRLAEGEDPVDLAEEFDVTVPNMYHIASGRTWK